MEERSRVKPPFGHVSSECIGNSHRDERGAEGAIVPSERELRYSVVDPQDLGSALQTFRASPLRSHKYELQVNSIKIGQDGQLDVAKSHPVFQIIQTNVLQTAYRYREDDDLAFNQ